MSARSALLGCYQDPEKEDPKYGAEPLLRSLLDEPQDAVRKRTRIVASRFFQLSLFLLLCLAALSRLESNKADSEIEATRLPIDSNCVTIDPTSGVEFDWTSVR